MYAFFYLLTRLLCINSDIQSDEFKFERLVDGSGFERYTVTTASNFEMDITADRYSPSSELTEVLHTKFVFIIWLLTCYVEI